MILKWIVYERSTEDVLMMEKIHRQVGTSQDLFVAHIEVWKPTKRQKLIHEEEIVKYICE